MSGRDAHRAATFVLSLLMAAIGVALIIQVAEGHGSVTSARLLLGVLFLAAGSGRIYVERRRARRGGDRDVG
jgi:predicted membrane channel-forming protein YqfA (hemolysin III family)